MYFSFFILQKRILSKYREYYAALFLKNDFYANANKKVLLYFIKMLIWEIEIISTLLGRAYDDRARFAIGMKC